MRSREFYKNILCVLIGIIIGWLYIGFVNQGVYIQGRSMEPNYKDGQFCAINKWIYKVREPERFDVIAFPVSNGSIYVKRIIGLPGETIQIKENGDIYINGAMLEENYGKETIHVDRIGNASEPIILGEKEYFVLGDNRNNSMDSRFEEIGNINRKNIIGKLSGK